MVRRGYGEECEGDKVDIQQRRERIITERKGREGDINRKKIEVGWVVIR